MNADPQRADVLTMEMFGLRESLRMPSGKDGILGMLNIE